MEVEKKSNNGLICAVVVLAILVIALVGYLVYDKLLTNNITITNNTNDTENTNNAINTSNDNKTFDEQEEVSFNSYNIGDKVSVKVNSSKEETFYVLKQSSKSDEFVTLFAEKNIGTSAFNTDYSDGNEYKNSLIESKLNELTTTWSNVKEKRLITIDEIKATGLTSKQQCGPSEDVLCDVINKNSWLKYKDEIYWTMTKVDSSDPSTGNTNRYVYYVDMEGFIKQVIVGYKPGSNLNPYGTFFENFGIRPVIVISKNYVK